MHINDSHRTSRLQSEGQAIEVDIDGARVSALAGESVAAVLMAEGRRIFTEANAYHLPRTLFCGMGICHQCLVTVDGVRDVRACMTRVQPGMKIMTQWTTGEQ